MTSKLTITDERLAELVAFKPLPGTDINSATRDEWMAMAAELHERRKADSEPYGFTDGDRRGMIYKPEHADRLNEPVPVYRHAQQPVVPDYPETLPCPVLLEPGLRFGKGVKTRLVLDAIQRRAEHSAELEAMTPEERAEYDAGIEAFKAMLPQPVPDNSAITQHFDTIALETAREIMCDVNRRQEFLGGEIQLLSRIQCRIDDACRAAMLQGAENTESRCGNSPANDTNVVKRLTITLPDTSSKAFWSGAGKTETFRPVTYRRWVKEALERCCAIARIDVEVK